MTSRSLGIIEILASGFFFGFLGLFGKMAYQAGLSTSELLSLRFLTSAIILGIGILLFKPQFFKMKKSERAASILLGLLGLSLFSGSYFFALQTLSASLTALLLYTYPILVAIGAQIWFHEKLGKAGWIALAGSTLGLILLLWGELQVQNPWGVAIGLNSALCYAAYILISRKFLKNANPWASIFWIQFSAGLCFFFMSGMDGSRVVEIYQQNILLILGIAVISSLIAMILFLRGLQKVQSAEVSILSTSEPVTAVIVASFFLGERLSALQTGGGFLVLASLILLAKRKTHA